MKHRHAGGSILLGLVLVLAASSCDERRDVSELDALHAGASGEPSDAMRCVPGQTRSCTGVCAEPSSGYQICAPDGAAYGACTCPPSSVIDGGLFDVNRGAVGGITILPTAVPDDDLPLNTPGNALQGSAGVGAICADDDDCAGGLICFDISDGLGIGGPAGGYCTRPCNSATQCEQVDDRSACGTLAGQNLCIRLCDAGELGAGEVKCLGRDDLTCVSLTALGDTPPRDQPNLGICGPRCQSDAACGGLNCDLASGFCSIFESQRLPIGSACTSGAECEGGICFALSAQAQRVCSAFCTLGAPGCGFDGSESRADAGCVIPQVPNESPGDRGLCLELCDSPADCSQTGSLCAEGPQDGRAGVCVKQAATGGPPPDDGEEPPPPDPADAANLGNPCASDSDCGGNLLCLTPDGDPFGLGGGPAEGYCSAPCLGSANCPGSGSVCVGAAGDGGLCLRGCELGVQDDCGGRGNVRCGDIGGGLGTCLPQCASDAACGERRCDVQRGLCVDALECSSDADCDDGICDLESGACVPASPGCTADADCASGQLCNTATGECAAPPANCTTDADCAPEQLCNIETGACVALEPPACTTDADCAPEQLCDVETGSCAAAPCVTDADCPGQLCNPSSGACIPAPAIPIGGACTDDTQCVAELCAPLGGSTFCSGFCLLGSVVGCEPYGSDAFCLYPVQDDIGACLELCNTAADCVQAGYRCLALTNPVNGHTGACLPPVPPSAPAAP
jgi:hypothetical protein